MKVIDPSKKPPKRLSSEVGESEDLQLKGSSVREPDKTDLPLPSKQLSLRMQALRLFLTSGSLARVSRDLNIPMYNLQQLSRSAWWAREIELIRREEIALETTQMTRIWNKTLEEIEDRLANGDIVTVKNKKVRRELSAMALARLADTIFDKRQLLRGEPTAVLGGNKKLEELAEKLTALGRKEPVSRLIDQEEVILEAEELEAAEEPPEGQSDIDWGTEDEDGSQDHDPQGD